MSDNTFLYLDFFKLLDILKSYTQTPYSKEEILNLRPFQDIEQIKKRQEILSEVYDLIVGHGKPPLSQIPDMGQILRKLSVGNSILDPKEFLIVADFLAKIRNLVSFLKKAPKKGNYISQLLESINQLPEVEKRIRRTINAQGFVEESASYQLFELRRELHIKRERIKKHLEKLMENERLRSLLQDNYITLRNGRYVIPMKPNFNQAIEGIVHDYSHTLKTSFVEPIECVGLNNEINILEKMEKEEEERILKELSSYINGYLGSIKRNIELVKELDLFCSFSLFAIDFDCVRPEVKESGDLYIKDAINPLLRVFKGDRVVPIDIILKENKSALIISGPNSGGKTVALKTIGLLILMAYSGLFIPAKGVPQIPIFRRVYALVGDEQDFLKDLSSFTSHVLAIKAMYEESEGGELVLIDEIGGGTDPQEASALSMGIIDAFVEKGCKIVVTTHLTHLKSYGFMKDFAENVACAYDEEKMVPLYKLVYGVVGMSNALHMAKSIGFPKHLIDRSLDYLGKQEYLFSSLVRSLKKEKEEVEKEKEEILRLKASLSEKIREIEDKKAEVQRKIEEEFRSKVNAIEAQIEEIEREIAKRDRVSIGRAKEMLEGLKREVKVENLDKKGEEELKVGDLVRIKSLGSIGYISDLPDDSGQYEVVIGNIRTRIKRAKLEKVSDRIGNLYVKDSPDVKVFSDKVDDWKLNIRGMSVDEALESLDRFMDKAILNGVNKIRILHGIGTGKLTSKVREYLSKSTYVTSFRLDDKNPGITIVELK